MDDIGNEANFETTTLGFESPYAGPYLMLVALAEHRLSGRGRIKYAPAFRAFE